MPMSQFQSLPGFREFYPEAFAQRKFIFDHWRLTARSFGFQEYDAPVLESLDLFKRKAGEEIENQLFSFTDKGGREVALRPEMTPTLCRMVGAKASSLKRPVKWFSIGEFYRYERAQKGRERAFYQFNADIFGEAGVEAEIELIALLIQSIASFDLSHEDFYIRLSDRTLWLCYLAELGFSKEQSLAILTSIDKYEKIGSDAFKIYEETHGPLDPGKQAEIEGLLHVKSLEMLENALSGIKGDTIKARLAEWRTLLGGLNAMGLGNFVSVDFGVVRGLAYYTGFVFEAFDRKGELRAIAGGGRYNDLVKKLGGPDMPAVGFAIGDVTMGLLLQQRNRQAKFIKTCDAYAIIGGPQERLEAFEDINALRSAGFHIEYPLHEIAFGKQFKAAAEAGAKLALIYGSEELARGVVKVRNMAERSEQEIPRQHLVEAVLNYLSEA